MNKRLRMISIALQLLYTTSLIASDDNLPSTIDLSKSKCFPPILAQGRIGTYDWFAAVYYQMTYLYNKAYDRTADSSNILSPQFGYNFLNNGGEFPYNIRVDDVYKFTIKHGSATIEEYPYTQIYLPWCTDPIIWKNAINYRIQSYSYFTFNEESPNANYSFPDSASYFNEIKQLLNIEKVLVVQTFPYSNISSKEIMDDPNTNEDDSLVGEKIIYSGNNSPEHTMAVVGYNDNIWVDLNNDSIVQSDEKGALKIADSYTGSTAIHNDGFLWMAYSTVLSSIWQTRVNVMNIRINYKPRIICKLTLNSSKRDNLRFQFGRTTPNSDTSSDTLSVFDPYGLGYELGTSGVSLIADADCAFDGGTTACDGSFTFDLTDIFVDNELDLWYLRIDNNGTEPCIIKEFEITDVLTGNYIKDTDLPQTLIQEETIRYLSHPTRNLYQPKRIESVSFKFGSVSFRSDRSVIDIRSNYNLNGGVLKIFSPKGQLVSQHLLLNDKLSISIGNLPANVYLIQVFDIKGRIKIQSTILNY